MPRTCLITARERAHLTQKQVAERLGITRSHYTKIEGGTRDPSFDVLQRICALLGTKPEELFTAPSSDGTSKTAVRA